MECLAAYTIFGQRFDAVLAYQLEGNIYRDRRFSIFEQFSILVPEDYDGIIFGYCDSEEILLSKEDFYAYIDNPEEEMSAEASTDWWQGSMYEYLEDITENYRFHYWGMISQETGANA